MKNITILLGLCVFVSCGDASHNMDGDRSIESFIAVDSFVANDTAVYEFEHGYAEYEYTPPKQPDSLEVLLEENILKFMALLQNNDFAGAQEMLHSNGVYFYTNGNIPKNDFSLKGLKRSKGILDGAYSYGLPDLDESDSIVSGEFWLDSLRYNYTNNSPKWHDEYSTMAYGFTGNFSSDHISWDDDWPSTPDSIKVHVAYIHHNTPEIDHRDILMIEFFEDKNGDWKIYAVGNLEWTP